MWDVIPPGVGGQAAFATRKGDTPSETAEAGEEVGTDEDADPTPLVLAVLAPLPGGLLLTVRRDRTPAEGARNTAIDHIAGFAADISGARA
ncbi:hypothetical protein [Sporichthya polymorpha]|uniref:hypothetical protein n=1 Tax=Sporichthya polymorpha TaxID=35751 RepID=UPI000374285A|nr:hypothetical protein [Sporichthya polymorpha]